MLLAGMLPVWCSLQAAILDPADLFLKAYQEFQNAERLEQQGIQDKALEKYRDTANLLLQIQKTNADWQSLVVSYRLRKTQENIARLELVPSSSFNASAAPQGINSRTTVSVNVPSLSITPPIENSLRPSDQPGTSSVSQLKKLRWQLEQAFRENQRLSAAIVGAEAEKQSALVEVDKIKVSLIEAKSQSSDAQSAAGLAREQAERLAQLQNAYKSQLATFQQKLTTLDADNTVLAEENDRLLTKLNSAATYIFESDKVRYGLAKDRLSFYKAASDAKKKLSRIKDNTKTILELKNTQKELLAQNADLSEKVASSRTTIEQATARAQNAEMEARKLAEQNSLLSVELAKSKEHPPNPPSEASTQLITQLRLKLQAANDELQRSQEFVSQGNQRISDLEKQLKNTQATLAQLQSSLGEKLQSQRTENELLRNIVLRAMQSQEERNQACQSIGKELAGLSVDSSLFSKQLNILKKPVLQLNEEEKDLFKEPIVTLSSRVDSSSVNASIAVFRKNHNGDSSAQNVPSSHLALHSETSEKSDSSLTEEQRSLAKQAESAFKEGRFNDCEKLYSRIVEKSPNNTLILANLGAVQSQLGKYSAAETTLRRALSHNPTDSFACTALGILQLKCGQPNVAIETLQNSVRLDSKNFSAHNYLGIAYGETGQLQEAEKELKTAIQLNPNYAIAHFNLAVLYSTQKLPNKELARKHYLLSTHLGAAPNPDLERLIR